MMYGGNDVLNDPTDAKHLVAELQSYGVNIVGEQIDGFSHIDFMIGMGAGKKVFERTIQILDQYVIQDGPK